MHAQPACLTAPLHCVDGRSSPNTPARCVCRPILPQACVCSTAMAAHCAAPHTHASSMLTAPSHVHSHTALCRWTQLTQHASALCVPPNPTTSMCVQHSNGCALCRTTHSCIKHAHCTQPCSQSHCMSLPPAQRHASDSRQCATCLQWILSLHAPF